MRPEDDDPRLMTAAGHVLGVVVVALLVATLLNTEAIVRAGEGMKRGPERDVVLSVGKPLDDFAGFVGLHLPRKGFDTAFGQESKTAKNTELEKGSVAILRRRRARAQRLHLTRPTIEHPLKILVTGDSESGFLGQQLAGLLPDQLTSVEVVPRDGTGLTNPGFFYWEVNAKQEIAARSPDAVVMAIGGNDGFNVTTAAGTFGPGTPEWETEFARRIAVVMAALSERGKRPVYWVAPPTARDPKYNEIYASQNRAAARAARAILGGRYIDDYNTLGGGKYTDTQVIDGRRVIARQSDGIHFSRDGALAPAQLVHRAIARDYPTLG
jgi:hypothetical protein